MITKTIENVPAAKAVEAMRNLHGRPHRVYVDAPWDDSGFAGIDLFAECSKDTGSSVEVSSCPAVSHKSGLIVFQVVPEDHAPRFEKWLSEIMFPEIASGGVVLPVLAPPSDEKKTKVFAAGSHAYTEFVGLVTFIFPRKFAADHPNVAHLRDQLREKFAEAARPKPGVN